MRAVIGGIGNGEYDAAMAALYARLPAIDFGSAVYLILPAEMFVEYQLAAQKLRPDKRVIVAGFGECAPGYTPTEKARQEGFVQEHAYCWNQAGAEEAIMAALKSVLEAK